MGLAEHRPLKGLPIGFRCLVYGLAGVKLDFFNPKPWLFTFPVPAAVLAAARPTLPGSSPGWIRWRSSNGGKAW
jgi:hypothetical protein